jgi:hypothetical protein
MDGRQGIRLLKGSEEALDPSPEGFHEDDHQWQNQEQEQEDERHRDSQPSDELLLRHHTSLR